MRCWLEILTLTFVCETLASLIAVMDTLVATDFEHELVLSFVQVCAACEQHGVLKLVGFAL